MNDFTPAKFSELESLHLKEEGYKVNDTFAVSSVSPVSIKKFADKEQPYEVDLGEGPKRYATFEEVKSVIKKK